ncbi:DAK2 domain-containing protein [Tannockella kyphosi]|uniref:DAK2 domain-containing protein n=1 Tax=Tannockella kyphosi TaxID=2899121 RepID=UPI0020128B4B|nr:DAK2 domain-containing protein [Tannockella kyphosi]
MKTINGKMFKEMVICGANNLHNNHLEIDALNVFPVPDGDTGTNMSLTFTAGSKEVSTMDTLDIYAVAKKLSKGLLMGARGNSGVILSQIFRGIATGLEGYSEVNAVQLANALNSGTKVAYKAVMRPVEGTILTVIRESSAAVVEYVQEDMDIEEMFDYFIQAAKVSLENTPELLPVLKEVGVVDSGGAGLLLVFEGFAKALAGETIEYLNVQGTGEVEMAGSDIEGGEDAFGYCTEFIVRLEDSLVDKFNEEQLKKELSRIPGDSIVVVQDEEIVKVHVHTLKPGEALNLAQRFGEFIKLKIENMQEQHNNIIEASEPTKKEAKEVGIISVCAGKGLEEAFLSLHCDYVVSGGQTMNPSTEDMVQAIRDLNAKHVIVLPNNSNIVMTAQQSATILEDEIDVIVIPTKTIPQGMSACVMYNPDIALEDNVAEMQEAIKNVQTGEVTFAIKDTNIDGVEIKANDYMAICNKSIVACKPNKLHALQTVLETLVDDESELITLIVGEDIVSADVEEMESYVEDHFDAEMEVVYGLQPVYSFIVGVE